MRFFLMLCIAAILAAGILMIFSTTSAEVMESDPQKNCQQAVIKQLYYAMGGVALATFTYNLGYQKFLKVSPLLMVLFTLLLVLILIPGIGREVNGSRRWLSLAGFSFQPSEFVKYIIPSFFIFRISKLKKDWTVREFLKIIAFPAVIIFLITIEPNNGTAFVIAMALVILCYLMRIPLKYWASPIAAIILIGGSFALQLPYVSGRLAVYLHPEKDLKGRGHQPYQAKIAVGSGGLLGRGPGKSLQKMSYLPEAQNDYIGAIYAEEFGFIGILFLIILYALIGIIGFYIALHTEDLSASYLAASIIYLICFQAFLNLGVVSGLLPSTGLNLPFFSQGGSSLMANLMGIGLLLSISKAPQAQDPSYG